MDENRLDKEVDLRDCLKIIGKRKWTILIILLACVFFTSLFTFLRKPLYRAKSIIEIGEMPGGHLMSPLMSPEATIQLCESGYFLNKVKAESKDSLIIISLDSSSPEEAAKIVNNVANFVVKEQNTLYQKKIGPLENEIKGIREQIKLVQSRKEKPFNQLLYLNQLQTRCDEIQGQIASCKKSKVIFPATIPKSPIKPRPVRNLALGIILGCFLGIFIAFFREYLSKS